MSAAVIIQYVSDFMCESKHTSKIKITVILGNRVRMGANVGNLGGEGLHRFSMNSYDIYGRMISFLAHPPPRFEYMIPKLAPMRVRMILPTNIANICCCLCVELKKWSSFEFPRFSPPKSRRPSADTKNTQSALLVVNVKMKF